MMPDCRRGKGLLLASLACALTAVASPIGAQTGVPRVLAWQESLSGSEEESLRWPVAVAAASAAEIAVGDAFGPRLLLFREVGATWQLARTLELPASPVALVHDGSRYLASLREDQGLVAFEGSQLAQRRIALPAGVVPGPLAARRNGNILVYDLASGRVLELTREGSRVRETPIDGRVTALAATATGGFYAALGDESTILLYDAFARLAASWRLPGDGPVPAWPTALAAAPGQQVLVVDRHGGRILVIDAQGRLTGQGSRRGWDPGLLRYPTGIALLPDGRVVVADQGNGRAQIFRLTDAITSP